MARPDEWINELPALVRAAAQGNISETADLLGTGSDPNEADQDGWTALHAAVFNHLPIVELLLQAGAAVDSRSLDGFTPLLNAARAEAPVVTALLNAGADPAAQEARLGWRPLDRFAEHANALAVRLLLNAGAEVDARDFSGQTALMDAAEAGSAECVELLLRAGVNPAVTREGQTARRWPRNTATITSLPTWPPATQQPRRRQTGLTGQIRHEDRGGVHAT